MTRFNKQYIMLAVACIATVLISLCVVYTCWVFVNHFGYTPELGIYDTRCYTYNVGEYIERGMNAVHYEYTKLNLIEVLKRIW